MMENIDTENAERLMEILDDIMQPPSVERARNRWSANPPTTVIEIILHKLRTAMGEPRPNGVATTNLFKAMEAQGLIRRSDRWKTCTSSVRDAIMVYLHTRGTTLHPILPQLQTMDAISVAYYCSFINMVERSDVRWALSRICLGLHQQWWWFGVPLTVLQAHSIVPDTYRHIANHWQPWMTQPVRELIEVCYYVLASIAQNQIVS